MKLAASIVCLVCVFDLAAGAPSIGGVSVFVGHSGQPGNVKVFDESGATAPQFPAPLQGIRLLSIDASGRSELNQFQVDTPRWVDDVPGASRLQLPHDKGSLYAYSRAAGAASTFGFMLIDATGVARSLFELDGTGLSQDQDPFIDRVSIEAQGDSMMVATTMAAGGDLYEIDFTTGAVQLRTASLASQDFWGAGIALGVDCGLAVSTGGILRFDRTTNADAQWVSFANAAQAPTWFMRELVLSYNGLFAATVAGADAQHAHVYVLDACCDAIEVDPQPMEILGAGFLPESIDGPFLAVSDDGTRAAWVALEVDSMSQLSQEAYLAAVPVVTTGGTAHVTNDGLFHPFLDEVGLYGFTPANRLQLGVGDPKDPSHPVGTGLTRMDCFIASIPDDTSGISVTDITQSGAYVYPPFDAYPTLDPQRVVLSPDRSAVVLYSLDANGVGTILGASTDAHGLPPLTVATGIETLWLLSPTANDIVYSFRTDDSNGEELAVVGHAPLDFQTQPSTILPLDDTDKNLGASDVRANGWAGVVTPDDSSGMQSLWRIQASTGQSTLFTHRAFNYGPTLAFTPNSSIAFSVGGLDKPSVFVVWPMTGPVKRLQAAPMIGFVLPAN